MEDLVQDFLERADEVENPDLGWFGRLQNRGACLVKGSLGFLPCEQGCAAAPCLFQGKHLGERGILFRCPSRTGAELGCFHLNQ